MSRQSESKRLLICSRLFPHPLTWVAPPRGSDHRHMAGGRLALCFTCEYDVIQRYCLGRSTSLNVGIGKCFRFAQIASDHPQTTSSRLDTVVTINGSRLQHDWDFRYRVRLHSYLRIFPALCRPP